MSNELALPQAADPRSWTPVQANLMVFAGLARRNPVTGELTIADAGVAEAFLVICRRTGLDPLAKQIYAMEVNGRLTIVTGIDGFRIVAQRSRGYAGQRGPFWTDGTMVDVPVIVDGHVVTMPDGTVLTRKEYHWVDVWLSTERPVAARIGIDREGFREPIWQVVTWAEFGIQAEKERYKGDNWFVRPAHMLAIRAETHGMRRTFPNDLSGLYTAEDFDAMSNLPADLGELQAAEGDTEIVARIRAITDEEEVKRYWHERRQQGMSDKVRDAFMTRLAELGLLKQQTGEAESATAHAEASQDATGTPAPVVVDAEPIPSPQNAADGTLSEEEYERLSAEQFALEHPDA